MHNKQSTLMDALNSYDLTRIVHSFDQSAINSLYQGQPILTLFANDCLRKLKDGRATFLTKFLGIYQELIELGANPNLVSEDKGNTTLHEVIKFGTNSLNILVLEKVLAHSSINKENYSDTTPFAYAIEYNNDLAYKLIMDLPSLKIKESDVISVASFCNDDAVLQKVFSSDEIDYKKIKTNEGDNLLNVALTHYNFTVIPFLIDLGINPLQQNYNNKCASQYIKNLTEFDPLLEKYINYFKLDKYYKDKDSAKPDKAEKNSLPKPIAKI